MKMLIIGAAIGATLVGVLPAAAEVVVRTPGVGIAVGERHDDGWRYRHGWRRHHAECRTIRVRKHLPNGNVIIKTRRTC